jgi:hypothetical protein
MFRSRWTALNVSILFFLEYVGELHIFVLRRLNGWRLYTMQSTSCSPPGRLTWQDQLNGTWAKEPNVLNAVGSSQYLLYVTPKVHGHINQVSLHWKENIPHTLIYWSLQQSSELTFLLVSTTFYGINYYNILFKKYNL